MNVACGATDCEADESRIEDKNQKTREICHGSFRSGTNSFETIELAQISGQTLGISIKGGVDHPFLVSKEKEVDTGIFVIHVYAGGLAAVDGRLQLGDRILLVNGESVENVKQKDFLKILGKGSTDGRNLKLTVKHNETLRKRLSSRQTTLPKPSVDSDTTSPANSNSPPLNGVQMLTGECCGQHFEPLESCANMNYISSTTANEEEAVIEASDCRPGSFSLNVDKEIRASESIVSASKLLLPATAVIIVALAAAAFFHRR